MYRTTFTVVGRWPFPVDMLRYDRCTPETEEDSYKVEALVRPPESLSELREEISISMVKTHEQKAHPRITDARWHSFHWRVATGSTRTEKV